MWLHSCPHLSIWKISQSTYFTELFFCGRHTNNSLLLNTVTAHLVTFGINICGYFKDMKEAQSCPRLHKKPLKLGNLNIMSPFHRHTQTHQWKSNSTTHNNNTGLFMYAWIREAQWLTRLTSPAHWTWTLSLWVCFAVISEAPLRLLHHTDDTQLAQVTQVHWSVQVAHIGQQSSPLWLFQCFSFFF